MARRLGRMLAQEGITLVSGGARGVDLAAQRALLEAGGSMILVPALPVSQVPMGKLERRAMEEGRMLIPVSYTHLDVYKRQSKDILSVHPDGAGSGPVQPAQHVQ